MTPPSSSVRRHSRAVFAFLALGLLPLGACRDLAASKILDDVVPTTGNGPGGGRGPSSGGNHDPKPSPSPSPEIPTASLYRGSSDLGPFVEKFVADGLVEGVDVIENMKDDPVTIQVASLDDLGANVIGLCETGVSGRTVTFDPDFWDVESDRQKEVLAHHELGHCVLGRDHRSGSLPSGDYLSIMNPIVMKPDMYDRNYDYYQKELYTYKGTLSEEAVDVKGGDRKFICDTTEL